MEPDSPFAGHATATPVKPSRIVHVNFCDVCHHVWKAPAAAISCINCKGINCKGNGDCARSLVSYMAKARIL